uniref:NADH dehydrogenase subunit 6 n=1 Tax=Brachidontes pharaonis TaxID=205971 RepID=UPI00203724A6|nr:NADH dehydrogenase subunit 6 [Brachidontes pharaonis]URF22677.1 NADH dehydrogenase subunit 6 [Brachidontes pharaonis]
MVLLVSFSVVVLMISMLLFVNEPYPLGGVLILSCVGVCYGLSYYLSSLLGFLVFMSYVGGVMVLFLYVVSIHPNQVFGRKIFTGSPIFGLSLVLSCCYGWYGSSFVVQSRLGSFHFINLGVYGELYLLMGAILLINLCIVCCICMKKSVPLRSFS